MEKPTETYQPITPEQLMEKARKRLMWLLRVILVIFILVFIQMQTNYIKQNKVEVITTGSNASEDALRIVQLSDMHGKLFSSKQSRLKVIFDKIDYDVVVFTGNLIDKKTINFKAVEVLLEYFEKENKLVLFVSGNHEVANQNVDELYALLDKYGVINLDNRAYKLQMSGDRNYSFVGISDPDLTNFTESDSIVSELLKSAQDNGEKTILLSHRPYYLENYKDTADLILSGHNNGGQIRLPFVGGIFSPDGGFFPDYDYGLYSSERSGGSGVGQMYVSKGLGNDAIPIRLFNFPEIAYITVK